MGGILEQLGINVTIFASIIQFIILIFIFVILAGVGLYFIIRLAVRDGLKDIQKDNSRGRKD